MNQKIQLPTLSGAMTTMSDSYLNDLSIDSAEKGQPNFFKQTDDGPAASMGPPPSRAWGGSLGNVLLTKSAGAERSGGESRAGNSPGYFSNNELSELFSIVRGKSVFGGNKNKNPAPGRVAGGGSTGGAPGMSFDMSMSGMPAHMRSLPPIRTKSVDLNNGAGSMMSGAVVGDSPGSELDLPDSAGRLVTGLTPHGGRGMMMMGTGLTPTGLTPGSLAGFPGIDHFSMNLPAGEGGLMPAMPGWRDPTGDFGDDPSQFDGAGEKRKATRSGGSGLSGGNTRKAAKKSNSKGKKCKHAGNASDDDDVPLSGLVRRSGGIGPQSAAAVAEAAAKKLGIPLPLRPVSTAQTEYEDDEDDETDKGKGGGKKSRSRSWLPSEDELVRSLVQQHGPRKWTLIATRLKTKTQKQVYARWRDYLQPGLTTKPWSAEEQARLVELQAHVGNQWAVLARLMPGRSPNAIKNRFHATKRKLERHIKRDGSALGQGASDATGGGAVSMSAGEGPGKSVGSLLRDMDAPSIAMSEEYSKEEQLAVEGLLLVDTPTSLLGAQEQKESDAHFDAALDVQDRLREEATKAAKAAAKTNRS